MVFRGCDPGGRGVVLRGRGVVLGVWSLWECVVLRGEGVVVLKGTLHPTVATAAIGTHPTDVFLFTGICHSVWEGGGRYLGMWGWGWG